MSSTNHENTLVGLVAQTNVITQMIMEANGELTPELEDALSKVDLAMADKVDGYAMVMDRMKAEEAYWKEKATSFARIASAHGRVRDVIKDRIKMAMLDMDKKEVKGNDMRFMLSTSKTPKLVIDSPSEIPSDMQMAVTTTIPDKDRILSALTEGFVVRGAHLEPVYTLRPYPNKKV